MGANRAGPTSTRSRVAYLHQRHLPRSENSQGPRHTFRYRHFGEIVSKIVYGVETSERNVVSHYRHRPGAAWRWKVLCAGGQSPLSIRRVLRSAESRDHEAHVSANLRSQQRTSGWRLSQSPASNSARHRASSIWIAGGGRIDAGNL